MHRKIHGLVVIACLTAASAGAQSTLGPASTTITLTSSRPNAGASPDPYLGSISSEALHPGVLDLSIQDALDRGLRVNLGLFLSSEGATRARAARLKAFSELLPHVNGSLRESTQRTNLRALGIPLPDIPRTVDVSNSDARVEADDSLDFSAISRARSAGASVSAARSSYQDAREAVAVAVSNAYLAVVTAKARRDAAEADLETARALNQLAQDRQKNGLSPEIDTLRAQVEEQSRQEAFIDADNALAKQRIVLLRLLGLNIHQSIHLTSQLSSELPPEPSSDAAYQQAFASRHDYQAAVHQVRSAELARRGAEFERAPKLGIAGNYGALGTAPGNAVATWKVGVTLQVPVFEGGRIQSDISDADASLRQKRAQLEDLRTRVTQEVDDALLDLEAAKKQVEVSHAALDYAGRALTQSRDRFSAGVTNNIEVIQAQEALAAANNQWIQSLYVYNAARIALARATGTAENSVRNLFSQTQSDATGGR